MEICASLETFGTEAAKADDEEVITVYRAKGAVIDDLNNAALAKWRDLARESAWKDYAAKSENNGALLEACRSRGGEEPGPTVVGFLGGRTCRPR